MRLTKHDEVAVLLDGGLGNQLFQYATGRSLALRLGAELILDTSALEIYRQGVTARQFELHRFRIAARLATDVEKSTFKRLRRWRGISFGTGKWRLIRERSPHYRTDFEKIRPSSYLSGYWQSHRYFTQVTKELTDELKATVPLSSASEYMQRAMEIGNSVALHIRRSDYVTLAAAAKFHGALPLSYYYNALTTLRSRVASPHFFIFSDDIPWCRKNLEIPSSEVTFIEHNVGVHAWEDLILMSHCRHQVIANSSFSWWAAWLGDQTHKSNPRCMTDRSSPRLVLAPDRWFAGDYQRTFDDRIPHHWTIAQC